MCWVEACLCAFAYIPKWGLFLVEKVRITAIKGADAAERCLCSEFLFSPSLLAVAIRWFTFIYLTFWWNMPENKVVVFMSLHHVLKFKALFYNFLTV